MNAFEILNGSRATKVEEILSHAEVARAVPLTRSDMGKRVFDRGASSKSSAARACFLELAKLSLTSLVRGDGDSPTMTGRSLCAIGSKRARAAFFRIELDAIAWLEVLHLAGGACDRV